MLTKFLFMILVIIISFFYAYYKKNKYKRPIEKYLLFCLILLFSLFFAFREFVFINNTGADYETYREWFNIRNFSNSFLSYKNIGFNILISLTKMIYNNYYFFLFIFGLIINYFILNFIDNNTSDVFLGIIIYACLFYFLTFNVMRQWMACSLFLYSFKYIKNGNFLKYLLIIIIASSFHDTAITLLFLYPLLRLELKKVFKFEIILFILSIILFARINDVIYFLNKICVSLGSDYFTKYSMEYMNTQAGNSTILIISLLLLILLNYNIYNNKKCFDEKKIYIYYFFNLILISLLSIKNGIFARYLIYFDCSLIPICSTSFELFEDKSRMILKILIIIVLVFKFILI